MPHVGGIAELICERREFTFSHCQKSVDVGISPNRNDLSPENSLI